MALNSLAKQGRFSEVLSLLEAMESASIKPTEVTFGTAINGAARANNSAAAVALRPAQGVHQTRVRPKHAVHRLLLLLRVETIVHDVLGVYLPRVEHHHLAMHLPLR